MKHLKKGKRYNLSFYKKKLDQVFSKFIRQRDADSHGRVRCFTCGRIYHWKEIQAGHYISRQHLNLRWAEYNVHPQCVGCNVFKKGNMDVYAIALQAKYGLDILQELQRQKQKIRKFTIGELINLIDRYEEKLLP